MLPSLRLRASTEPEWESNSGFIRCAAFSNFLTPLRNLRRLRRGSCTAADRVRLIGSASPGPAGGGLRAQVLREFHHGPLGGHFWRIKAGSLVRRLAFWVCQDVHVAEYVRSCQTCQRAKAEHRDCGPRGPLHPLPLPSRRGRGGNLNIGVDWIAGLPMTPAGFDMIQNHVDLMSGKVHVVLTRSTATRATADTSDEHPRQVPPVRRRVPRRFRDGSRARC